MDIDAVAGLLGVGTLPDAAAAAAAAAAPPTQLAPLGAFDSQPVVPPPTAGGSSSLTAVHGLAAPVALSAGGSAAPASAGVVSFKDLVLGLQNDPSLPVTVKDRISVLGNEYNTHDKAAFFSQLKDLVGKERIKQIMLSLKRGAPSAGGAADRAPKRGAPDTQEMAPPPNKRMRGGVTDGYADASAEAEAASAGGAGGAGGGAGGEDMRTQFDVLHQSGVDLAAEDAAMSIADAVAEMTLTLTPTPTPTPTPTTPTLTSTLTLTRWRRRGGPRRLRRARPTGPL